MTDPVIIPVTPPQVVTTPAQPQPIALLNASGVSVSGGLSIGSANLETLTIQRRDDGNAHAELSGEHRAGERTR